MAWSLNGRLNNTAGSAQTTRADGYDDYSARVVCAFQKQAEAHNCDYNALRSTLAYARTADQSTITLDTLQAVYNSFKA